jgi:hypothetical protein
MYTVDPPGISAYTAVAIQSGIRAQPWDAGYGGTSG